MSVSAGERGISVTELGGNLPDGNRTLLLGAPELGKSECLDHLDETGRAMVVRAVDDLASLSSDRDRPVVFDNFYGLFSRYCRNEIEQRAEFQGMVSKLLASETTVAVCTTPYRLQWMLRERRDTFERLLGEPTEWTGVPVYVDEASARAFLERELPAGVDWTTDQLRETEWEYPLGERFDDCLRSDESVGELFGETTYRTYLPSMLVGDGTTGDVGAILDDRESTLATIKGMLGDVAENRGVEEGAGLLDGARSFAGMLRDEGMLDILQDEVEGLLSGSLNTGLGAMAATLSPAALPVACVAYWAYATRNDPTKETVRSEFRSIFAGELRELPAAMQEEVEEEFELAPGTLRNLNRVASGVTLDRIERAIDRVKRAHGRLDELETTVERHEAVVERIEETLTKRRHRTRTYQTLEAFKTDELLDVPDYEVPKYEVGPPTSTSVDADDPRDAIVDILDHDGPSVVLLTGESGIGKTRLMIEVAERVRDGEERDTRFVVDIPPETREPPTTGDTVLFVDEVGRKSNPEYFLGLASTERRHTDTEVQVVAAVRPVYEETFSEQQFDPKAIPGSASQVKIKLEPFEEARQTVDLLSDLGIDLEFAEKIHEATEGNPGLSRLIARPETESSGDHPSIRDAFEEIIDRTILKEAELLGRTNVVTILTAVAFLGECGIDWIDDSLARKLGIDPYAVKEVLDNLAKTEYLEKNTDGRPTYTHRFDILAEYLRYRNLIEEDGDVYEPLFNHALTTDAVGITRGLLELGRSTLRRFDFVDDEALEDAVDEELERVAVEVVDSDAPLADVFEVQALVGLAKPDAIPHESLKDRLDEAEAVGVPVAEPLRALSTVLYRQAERTTDLEAAGVEAPDLPYGPSSDLFGHARAWLTRLETLHDDTDNPEISVAFAKGLVNATVDEGDADNDNLDEVHDLLDRLEELHDKTDNPEISVEFAKGLVNATVDEGDADNDNLDEVHDLLDRLEELHDKTDNPEISVAFAKGLFNAIVDEGDADNDNLDEVHDLLDDLSALAGSHPGNSEVVEVATFGHVRALGYYVTGDASDHPVDAIDSIDDLVESVDCLGFGAKSAAARETLEDVTEHLFRAGQFDRFETLADALREGLPAGQWRAVSIDIGTVATDLHTRGVISADEYQRVMIALDDSSD